jgi:CheY-like chemotaxis protein
MINRLNPIFRKVMIIDDNEIDIFIASKMILKHSLAEKIIKYNNAKDALDYLIKNQSDIKELPEIILLDINMPLMTGFEFIDIYEKLDSNLKSHCKVYIVSSTIDKDDIERARSNKNIVAFQVKPVTTKFLNSIASKSLLR